MSEYSTINGQRIIGGNIYIPMNGVWVADVVAALSSVVSNPIQLVVGNLSMNGNIFRQGAFTGSRSFRLVGGNGGLRKVLPPQSYYSSKGIRLSTVVNDAARAVGEQVNIGVDRILAPHFVRDEVIMSDFIRQVLSQAWWVDNSGVIQSKARSDASKITSQFDVVSWSGGQGKFQIATEDVAAFMPYRTFSNVTVPDTQQISQTNIQLDNDGKLRLDVLSVGPL